MTVQELFCAEQGHYSDSLVSRTADSGGSTIWPVTLVQVKDNAQIQHDSDDLLIHDGNDGILPAAVEYIEELGRVALVTQTRRMVIDNWFPEIITPPRSPLLTVSSITYLDDNYASQTVDSADYRADTGSQPGRIKCKSGEAWPTPVCDIAAVTVNYTCGFGATAASVPPRWKKPIIALASYWWQHRENYDNRFVSQAFNDQLKSMIDVAGRVLRYV